MFEKLENIDRVLLLKINGLHTPLADDFFWLVSEGWLFLPLWIFLAIYIVKTKKIKYFFLAAFCAGLTILFCDQSSTLTKVAVQRYRPTHNIEIKDQIHLVHDSHGGKFGFFSAHAANTFGVITFLFLCLNKVSKKYRLLLFICPLLVGYSRVYIGVHYPLDILFGYFTGVFWGFLCFRLFKNLLVRMDIVHE